MGAETLSPDTLAEVTNLTGVVGDVQDDPDSPDGNWLDASDNNVNTDARVTFGTPTGDPTVGVDAQEFKAFVHQFDEGQTGTPDARIELWENGSLVRAGTDEAVPDGGLLLSFTWNANELGTADGSFVECKVVGTKSGGSPTARNTVEVDAIEWNAEVSAPVIAIPPAITVTVTGPVPTILVTDHKIAVPPAVSVVVTGPVPTILASDHKTVAPPAVTITVTGPAPTVIASDHKVATPPAVTVAVTGPVPTVAISDNKTATPPAATVTVTGPAPTVIVTEQRVVTPPAASIVVTGPVPVIAITGHKTVTPPVATITVMGPVPTIAVGVRAIPPAASVTITGPVPAVLVSDHKLVQPAAASVVVTGPVPTIAVSDHKTVTPPSVSVTVTGPAPTVIASDHQTVTPPAATVTVTGPAPTIRIGADQVVIPPPITVTVTGPAPTVIIEGGDVTAIPAPANVVVTGPAPHVAVASPARNVQLAHRLDALGAPGITDDSSMRYSVGSLWVDTVANLVYQCVDASVGAAVWKHLSSGGSPYPMGWASVVNGDRFSGSIPLAYTQVLELAAQAPIAAPGRLVAFASFVRVVLDPTVTVDVVLRRNGADVADSLLTFNDTDAVGVAKTSQFSEAVAPGDLLAVMYRRSAPTTSGQFGCTAYWHGD